MAIGNAAARASLKGVLEGADFVTLHVPATPATNQLIGAAELSSMRKGVPGPASITRLWKCAAAG